MRNWIRTEPMRAGYALVIALQVLDAALEIEPGATGLLVVRGVIAALTWGVGEFLRTLATPVADPAVVHNGKRIPLIPARPDPAADRLA